MTAPAIDTLTDLEKVERIFLEAVAHAEAAIIAGLRNFHPGLEEPLIAHAMARALVAHAALHVIAGIPGPIARAEVMVELVGHFDQECARHILAELDRSRGGVH